MNNLLVINPKHEKEKITAFLTKTFKDQGIDHAVIGLSGGIDSMTSFFLLKEVLPPEKIIIAHLYYFDSVYLAIEQVLKEAKLPKDNIYHLSIKEPVDAILKLQKIKNTGDNKMRIGNIAARLRMIVLFDLSKKYQGLVVGTENKTENLLGYFTRFGDQASDIEPIEHLYKTQVLQLAKYLGVPENFIIQQPTAGLWHGQTDEGEFGFTYEEADQVLSLHLEQNKSVTDLVAMGLKNAPKIISWHQQNRFKQQVPYHL